LRRARQSATWIGIGVGLALLGGCYTGIDRDSQGAATEGDGEGDGGGDDGGSDTSGDDGGVEENHAPLQPLHRLNRLEYDNTVRDLLGTELRPAAAFSTDTVANGFDNMADQLTVTPGLLDGYDKAAHEVIADALDDRPAFRARFVSEELGVAGGYPVGDLWGLSGAAVDVQVEMPQDGDSEIVLMAGGSVVGTAGIPTISFEVDGVAVASFTVTATAANPEAHVHALPLTAGPHTIRVVPTNFVNSPEINISNNVLVASLEVRTTAMVAGPGRSRVYVCEPVGPQAGACWLDIIHTFAFRAWRRPLTADEEASLATLWAQVRADGETESDALRLVMRAVMLSPKFFYRARTDADADAGEWLDPWVLASRLSYFLWSSMPDDRLFEAARDGSLATDEGLSEAVAWMLADQKSEALLDGFAEQWLSARAAAEAKPSAELFPAYDDALREAITQESKLFFGEFLGGDAPVVDMLRPSFAYRNDRLAAHYGLAPVGSEELVRVPAIDGDRRGILSLAAWLIANSEAEHSSPIRRGRWVSDTILCTPVPPPPAGIDIEPIELGGDKTVREQLEAHRADPTCNACHSMLDVVGIGFEDYDATAAPILGVEVDNLGELPDGTPFAGADELAEVLGDSEAFAGCVTTKLFTYAVGRAPEPSFDGDHLDEIAARAIEQRLAVAEIIDAIVHMPAFRSPAPLTATESEGD
jgi:hypothetical protein